jgi:hypothetical protein
MILKILFRTKIRQKITEAMPWRGHYEFKDGLKTI